MSQCMISLYQHLCHVLLQTSHVSQHMTHVATDDSSIVTFVTHFATDNSSVETNELSVATCDTNVHSPMIFCGNLQKVETQLRGECGI